MMIKVRFVAWQEQKSGSDNGHMIMMGHTDDLALEYGIVGPEPPFSRTPVAPVSSADRNRNPKNSM